MIKQKIRIWRNLRKSTRISKTINQRKTTDTINVPWSFSCVLCNESDVMCLCSCNADANAVTEQKNKHLSMQCFEKRRVKYEVPWGSERVWLSSTISVEFCRNSAIGASCISKSYNEAWNKTKISKLSTQSNKAIARGVFSNQANRAHDKWPAKTNVPWLGMFTMGRTEATSHYTVTDSRSAFEVVVSFSPIDFLISTT
jgi:hypothetical protein